MKDFYAIMSGLSRARGGRELPRSSSPAEIRCMYRELAKELHPDKPGGDVEAFKQLQEAYAVLGNPVKRKMYDLQFKVAEFPRPTAGPVDLMEILRTAAAGRVPQPFIDQLSPVLERALEDRGIKARAATAEDILQAVGWLKPKRKKRA